MIRIYIALFLLSISFNNQISAQKSSRIPLENIEQLFKNMKSNGVNTESNFLYGYFFTALKKDKLEKAVKALESMKFKFVKIYQSDDKKLWWLHVERIEKHNPFSLHKLNSELYSLAVKYKIEYDGFDLGNPDPNKPIERDSYAVPEDFAVANVVYDSFPMFIMLNKAFDQFEHKREFNYTIEISFDYNGDKSFMLPDRKELERMEKIELNIEKGLAEKSEHLKNLKYYYLFRTTHKNKRTIYFACSDPEKMDILLKSVISENINYRIYKDSDWSNYQNFRSLLPNKN